ncbi:MAG: hypothetical protein FWH35_09325, partial [Treponema sp.]|nr:hypothetical protein [Treponema sp.]
IIRMSGRLPLKSEKGLNFAIRESKINTMAIIDRRMMLLKDDPGIKADKESMSRKPILKPAGSL